ncbi:MAG: hypothetical protein JW982_03445 [Spirochaetes bacterium]|nr:hypothetical protein [Spirochaetota bacterium]
MSKAGFIEIQDKEKYLKDNYPFTDVPQLSAKKRCIHCDKVIKVGDYKVYRDNHGMEFIVCPNSPECDGTIIDWM